MKPSNHTTPPDKTTVRNPRMALGPRHQLALSALDVDSILRLRSTSLGEVPKVKITLKPLPYQAKAESGNLRAETSLPFRADELPALKARIAELEEANALLKKQSDEAVARAQREDRVRSAPGFREVDRIDAWHARSGHARLAVKVVITGKTVAITDLAR